MNRRHLLAFLAASPVVIASALRPEPVAAHAVVPDPEPFPVVGTRAWYIDRMAEQVLNGAAICTADKGALFNWCRQKHAEGVLRGPTLYEAFGPSQWAEKRARWFGPDPVSPTRHYYYWDVPRARVDRLALMQGLRAAAWRDAGFGHLPDTGGDLPPLARTLHA